MKLTPRNLSRRTFLRGLGASIALPWLESIPAWADETTSRLSNEPPVRFACVFAGNGFVRKDWWAKETDGTLELGEVLAPVEAFKEKLTFIRGLYNPNARGCGIHSCMTGNLLTGTRLASGGQIRAGVSVDQRLAQHVGRRTKVNSLVLGCEKPYAGIHAGYSMLYSSHISWSTATTPAPLELYPAAAFDRLFGDGGVRRADASVLDSVLGDARIVRREVSALDRRKLDEYLNSIREVERRIDEAGKDRRLEGWRPTTDKPTMKRPVDDMPQDIDVHMRLMSDLMVLAFQTDTTRRLYAEAEQRPFGPEVSESGHRSHHPPPAVARGKQPGLVPSEPVFRQPSCPHSRRPGCRPGRRANPAGQHRDPVLFQHAHRLPRQ